MTVTQHLNKYNISPFESAPVMGVTANRNLTTWLSLQQPLNHAYNYGENNRQNNAGYDWKVETAFFAFDADVAGQATDEPKLASEKKNDHTNCSDRNACKNEVLADDGIHVAKIPID